MSPGIPKMQTDGPNLTLRQQQVFELVLYAIATRGAPSVRAEIAKELGFLFNKCS